MRRNHLICNRQTNDSRKSIIGCRVLEIFHTISGNRYSEIDIRESIFGNRFSLMENRYLEVDIYGIQSATKIPSEMCKLPVLDLDFISIRSLTSVLVY